MNKTIHDFYASNQHNIIPHESVAGFYTNDHIVQMEKLDLDSFRHIRAKIVSEMKGIMQWWTRRQLTHTSTFGVRIYKENNMLINHVDRADTHLASAVLQVAQSGDAGWPLEVIGADGETYEVYLQPGEMVLYEGARLFHGRPMRFQGSWFANIFSHFAPLGYKGPHAKQHGPEYVEQGPADEYLHHSEL